MKIDEMLIREGIRKTIAQHSASGDQLRADELAEIFIENGVFESEGVPDPDAFRFDGR